MLEGRKVKGVLSFPLFPDTSTVCDPIQALPAKGWPGPSEDDEGEDDGDFSVQYAFAKGLFVLHYSSAICSD